MPSGARVPPCSLSATPMSSPWPGIPSPGLGLGLGDILAPLHLCHPPKVCPDCQPHAALPQGTGGTAVAPDCTLMSSSLVPHTPPPATSLEL